MFRTRNPRAGQGLRAGFTLLELMVVVAIIGILVAVVVPAVTVALERGRRVRCAANMRGIAQAMLIKATEGNERVVAAPGSEGLLNSVGAARNVQPVADRPTPVSATMWQSLRNAGLSPSMFVCPSSPHRADTASALDSDVWDFQSGACLSYAIQYPYGANTYLGRATLSPSEMPILADRGPFQGDGGSLAAMPATSVGDIDTWMTQSLNRARVNSANHAGAGQNVVYADGHCDWCEKPAVGPRGDNIFTIREADSPVGRMRGKAPSVADKEPADALDAVLVY